MVQNLEPLLFKYLNSWTSSRVLKVLRPELRSTLVEAPCKKKGKPNQPERKLDHTDFATAATSDATWHQRDKIDAELTKRAECNLNL
ncbi:hypothetical protein EVAR_93970_1 [Eumeta japonica]|uniref:Uncharacterized protein n=1 Tax=Eumeta variegata TaxID=151549 RepID=A0A4C1TP84_EUMVA|nr:hypothetical protein EVAR_93970_1 [Eumeta japonica]